MPRFLLRDSDALLSTSYKVMYSSFVESGLEEIDGPAFAAIAATRARDPGFRHLMAVRDPYARLASFFADKLRRDLERNSGAWQFCQMIFFPLLGIGLGDGFETVRDALRSISFEGFIDMLPRVCGNGHLRPQVNLLAVEGLDLKACTRIFPIETEAERLWTCLGIARPPRANSSEALPSLESLRRDQLDLVNTLYAEDFESFGYAMR